MEPDATFSLSPDIVPELAEAGLDLRHYGELWMLAEENALQRAEEARDPVPAELALEARLASDRGRQTAAVETVRATASDFPEAFNEAVAASLSDESIDPEARAAFEAGIGVIGGDFAGSAIEICDRIAASLRDMSNFPVSGESGEPPVGGGESLGCDLIVVAGMAGGATCVMGCGPCCIGAAAAVLGYVSFC
ncbi:MAG TPA: hypothetical protein VFP05_00175 [Thermomicrobiales bacterium]|nr:hypothetical protein [Thermomicrobiales bacterium]